MNPVAVLTLTLQQNGSVEVSGPIDNPMICYGMLGLAHDAIQERLMAMKTKVQPATVADLKLMGAQ